MRQRAAIVVTTLALLGGCAVDPAASGPLYSPVVNATLTATASDVRPDGRLVALRPIDAEEDTAWAIWLEEVEAACGGEVPEALEVRSVSLRLDQADSEGLTVLEEVLGDATVTVFVQTSDGHRANLATRGRVVGSGPIALDVVGDADALESVRGALLEGRFQFGLESRRDGTGPFVMALSLAISAKATCKLPEPAAETSE